MEDPFLDPQGYRNPQICKSSSLVLYDLWKCSLVTSRGVQRPKEAACGLINAPSSVITGSAVWKSLRKLPEHDWRTSLIVSRSSGLAFHDRLRTHGELSPWKTNWWINKPDLYVDFSMSPFLEVPIGQVFTLPAWMRGHGKHLSMATSQYHFKLPPSSQSASESHCSRVAVGVGG